MDSYRLYVTGDTHRHWVERLSFQNFPESREFDFEDRDKIFVLVLGDFGIWNDDRQEEYSLKWLGDRPFTTLFIDGNHENFTRLNQYPMEEWHGGKVHRIGPSVLHLMRGQVFEIGGRKIFTFGGARCHDIEDGILDPAAPDYLLRKKEQVRRGHRYFRTLGVDYWQEELPTEAELEEGLKNLERNNNSVDFVATHCTYTSLQSYIVEGSREYKTDILTDYFEELNKNVRYDRWFFGHYHTDTGLIEYGGKNVQCMFENIIRVF